MEQQKLRLLHSSKFSSANQSLKVVSTQNTLVQRVDSGIMFDEAGSSVCLSETCLSSLCIACVQIEPYLPYEFTCEGMLQRVNAFIENQVQPVDVFLTDLITHVC